MNFKTRYNLFLLKKAGTPSRALKRDLFRQLDAAWDAQYGRSARYQGFVWYQKAVVVAALVVMLVSAGGAYAYADPQITEGDALFSVKQAIERVEEVTKITPEAKAAFYLKKIERRELERNLVALKNAHKPVSEIKMKKTDEDSDKKDSAVKIQRQDMREKIEKIETMIDRAEDDLAKTKALIEKNEQIGNSRIKKDIKEKIEKRLEERKKRLERIQNKERDSLINQKNERD